ncbi:MAG: secretin N-terminal domain-containing protein [Pseudomonadota bacterium]
MNQYFALGFCLLFANVLFADSYQAIELRHRSGAVIENLLNDIVSEQLSVSAEGSTLLLRGPSADIKQLTTIIKQLDRPRKPINVSIYRGARPLTSGSTSSTEWRSTTKEPATRNNLTIDDGSTVVIAEQQLLPLTLEAYYWRQLQGREQARQKLIEPLNGPVSPAGGEYKNQQLINRVYGVELIPTLLKDEKISLVATFSTPLREHSNSNGGLNAMATTITRVLPLGKWVSLTQQQQNTERGNLDKRYQVVSTRKQNELDSQIWVKFERPK